MDKQQMESWVLKNCKFAQASKLDAVVREVGDLVLPAIQQLKGKGQTAPTDIKMAIRQKLLPYLKNRPDLQSESGEIESLIQQYVARSMQAVPAAPIAKPVAPMGLRKPFEGV
jgi:hypothetical protein